MQLQNKKTTMQLVVDHSAIVNSIKKTHAYFTLIAGSSDHLDHWRLIFFPLIAGNAGVLSHVSKSHHVVFIVDMDQGYVWNGMGQSQTAVLLYFWHVTQLWFSRLNENKRNLTLLISSTIS
eukprot:TRINITY_DN39542_c0_g1_i1.p1 TRINITY_DN39542_c0_g1~~TRINITY_DN39542_c0_g1_i1.p1  ORF type:complete len:121 (+),score=13.14 TRINITY_DN39542_c0_g1_i1:711-1073(+)